MWSMLLNLDTYECKRLLRKQELEAYSCVLDVFRAQGDLNIEKKKILEDLASVLSIPLERQRGEVRRALSNEKLFTIAYKLFGPNCYREWTIEGKRLVPLLPRALPLTTYTTLADSCANAVTIKESGLPEPTNTQSLKRGPSSAPLHPPLTAEQPKGKTANKRKCQTVEKNNKRVKIALPSKAVNNEHLKAASTSTFETTTVRSTREYKPRKCKSISIESRVTTRSRKTFSETTPSSTPPVSNRVLRRPVQASGSTQSLIPSSRPLEMFAIPPLPPPSKTPSTISRKIVSSLNSGSTPVQSSCKLSKSQSLTPKSSSKSRKTSSTKSIIFPAEQPTPVPEKSPLSSTQPKSSKLRKTSSTKTIISLAHQPTRISAKSSLKTDKRPSLVRESNSSLNEATSVELPASLSTKSIIFPAEQPIPVPQKSLSTSSSSSLKSRKIVSSLNKESTTVESSCKLSTSPLFATPQSSSKSDKAPSLVRESNSSLNEATSVELPASLSTKSIIFPAEQPIPVPQKSLSTSSSSSLKSRKIVSSLNKESTTVESSCKLSTSPLFATPQSSSKSDKAPSLVRESNSSLNEATSVELPASLSTKSIIFQAEQPIPVPEKSLSTSSSSSLKSRKRPSLVRESSSSQKKTKVKSSKIVSSLNRDSTTVQSSCKLSTSPLFSTPQSSSKSDKAPSLVRESCSSLNEATSVEQPASLSTKSINSLAEQPMPVSEKLSLTPKFSSKSRKTSSTKTIISLAHQPTKSKSSSKSRKRPSLVQESSSSKNKTKVKSRKIVSSLVRESNSSLNEAISVELPASLSTKSIISLAHQPTRISAKSSLKTDKRPSLVGESNSSLNEATSVEQPASLSTKSSSKSDKAPSLVRKSNSSLNEATSVEQPASLSTKSSSKSDKAPSLVRKSNSSLNEATSVEQPASISTKSIISLAHQPTRISAKSSSKSNKAPSLVRESSSSQKKTKVKSSKIVSSLNRDSTTVESSCKLLTSPLFATPQSSSKSDKAPSLVRESNSSLNEATSVESPASLSTKSIIFPAEQPIPVPEKSLSTSPSSSLKSRNIVSSLNRDSTTVQSSCKLSTSPLFATPQSSSKSDKAPSLVRESNSSLNEATSVESPASLSTKSINSLAHQKTMISARLYLKERKQLSLVRESSSSRNKTKVKSRKIVSSLNRDSTTVESSCKLSTSPLFATPQSSSKSDKAPSLVRESNSSLNEATSVEQPASISTKSIISLAHQPTRISAKSSSKSNKAPSLVRESSSSQKKTKVKSSKIVSSLNRDSTTVESSCKLLTSPLFATPQSSSKSDKAPSLVRESNSSLNEATSVESPASLSTKSIIFPAEQPIPVPEKSLSTSPSSSLKSRNIVSSLNRDSTTVQSSCKLSTSPLFATPQSSSKSDKAPSLVRESNSSLNEATSVESPASLSTKSINSLAHQKTMISARLYLKERKQLSLVRESSSSRNKTKVKSRKIVSSLNRDSTTVESSCKLSTSPLFATPQSSSKSDKAPSLVRESNSSLNEAISVEQPASLSTKSIIFPAEQPIPVSEKSLSTSTKQNILKILRTIPLIRKSHSSLVKPHMSVCLNPIPPSSLLPSLPSKSLSQPSLNPQLSPSPTPKVVDKSYMISNFLKLEKNTSTATLNSPVISTTHVVHDRPVDRSISDAFGLLEISRQSEMALDTGQTLCIPIGNANTSSVPTVLAPNLTKKSTIIKPQSTVTKVIPDATPEKIVDSAVESGNELNIIATTSAHPTMIVCENLITNETRESVISREEVRTTTVSQTPTLRPSNTGNVSTLEQRPSMSSQIDVIDLSD